jgi:hypothetical protein
VTEQVWADHVRSTSRHHVVIAGTGRAGTSFLVKFLESCGFDIGDTGIWVDDARAGLEHYLLDEDSPYVVKDPWLFDYCHEIDTTVVTVDALIVPVRELFAAATSRVFQERLDMAQGPFGARPLSAVRGGADAGIVYSLDPTDQARILAVGFHRLIHWSAVNRIPLFLLDFPRAVEDRDYLVDTLWPLLSARCNRQQALRAFMTTAEPSLVRIQTTLPSNDSTDVAEIERALIATRLDRDALAAALEKRNAVLADAETRLAEAETRLAEAETRLAEAGTRASGQEAARVSAMEQLGEMRRALDDMRIDRDRTGAENEALRLTFSWRVTRPLRILRGLYPVR